MKSLDEIKEITQLIDEYGILLSSCKLKYIDNYYFKNYTLREIAETYNISHAAVHDAIKEGVKELYAFEDNLKFINKQKKRILFYRNKIKDKQLLQELLELEIGKKISC